MSATVGEVPDLPVRVDEVEAAAGELRRRVEGLTSPADDLASEWRGVVRCYDAPETPRLVEAMSAAAAESAPVADALARVAEIVDDFASLLYWLQLRRSALADDLAAHAAALAPDPREADRLHDALARLRHDIDDIIEDARRSLAAIDAPTPWAIGVPPQVSPIATATWSDRAAALTTEVLLAPITALARADADRARRLLRAHPEWTDRLHARPPAPEAVRVWWDALAPSVARTLIDAAPAVVGGLDGVPLAARVAANRVIARQRRDDLADQIVGAERAARESVLADQRVDRARTLADLRVTRAYLDRVARGDVQLVLYQPDRNRIVEMFGEPGPSTKRVLTYVPGTFTTVQSFAEGGVQRVASWMGEQGEGTVTFVWKGTTFPGDDEGPEWNGRAAGLSEANGQDLAIAAGQDLARFEAAIRTDPQLGDTRWIAAGHSWGLVPITASEMQGARYDQVHSLAGAWVPRGWRADPATVYQHWSYTDFLSMAQDLGVVGEGRNPDVTPAFESHVFAREGDFDLPLGGDLAPFLDPDGPSMKLTLSPVGNHGLIADSSAENVPVLDRVRARMVE